MRLPFKVFLEYFEKKGWYLCSTSFLQVYWNNDSVLLFFDLLWWSVGCSRGNVGELRGQSKVNLDRISESILTCYWLFFGRSRRSRNHLGPFFGYFWNFYDPDMSWGGLGPHVGWHAHPLLKSGFLLDPIRQQLPKSLHTASCPGLPVAVLGPQSYPVLASRVAQSFASSQWGFQ